MAATVAVFTQAQLDLFDRAQAKVAADSEALVASAILPYPAGSNPVSLPADVVRLRGVWISTTRVPLLTTEQGLAVLSGGDAPSSPAHFVIGRSLYLLPAPTATTALTLLYIRRPNALASTSSAATLELDGDYALLVERVRRWWELADDGQPERAESNMGYYDVELPRLRRRRGGRERRRTLPVRGYTDGPGEA